jgi:hypothetical protein
MKNYLPLICLLATLLVVSCGSEEAATSAIKRRVPKLPEVAQIQGSIPTGVLIKRSEFGGSQLAQISFTAEVQLSPSFDVSEVQWARAEMREVMAPPIGGCELTGTEVVFPSDVSTAEIHLWGWETDGECEAYLERAVVEGISWRFTGVPGLYGETIRQADFTFRPANRLSQ